MEKSCIFYSSNLDGRTRSIVKRLLHLWEIKSDARYLGNPMFFYRSKIKACNYIREMVANRLSSWKRKLLL